MLMYGPCMTIPPKFGLQVFLLQDFASAAPPNGLSGVDAHRMPREIFHIPDGCTGGVQIAELA